MGCKMSRKCLDNVLIMTTIGITEAPVSMLKKKLITSKIESFVKVDSLRKIFGMRSCTKKFNSKHSIYWYFELILYCIQLLTGKDNILFDKSIKELTKISWSVLFVIIF